MWQYKKMFRNRLVNRLKIIYQGFLRFLLGSRYNPPKTLWYGGRFVAWYPDEAFIQLYGLLSKGGCQDFTEETKYNGEWELECGADEKYSYLTFHHIEQAGCAHFFQVPLGVNDRLISPLAPEMFKDMNACYWGSNTI